MKHKLVKRVIALALSFTLVLALFVAPMAVSASDDDIVVYRLTQDALVQDLAVGTNIPEGYGVWDDSPLLRVGPSTYAIIESRYGGQGVRIGDRGNTWQGIDVRVGGSLDLAGLTLTDGEYTLLISGTAAGGMTLQLGGGDSPYSGFVTQTVSAGVFELQHTFTLEEILPMGVERRGHIRINTTAGNGDITIHEILLVRGSSVPAGLLVEVGEAYVPAEAPPGLQIGGAGVVYNMLEDEEFVQALPMGVLGDHIAGIPFMTNAGDIIVTAIPNPFGGVALRISGRTAEWNAVDFLWGMFEFSDGGEYTMQIIGDITRDDYFIVAGSSSPHNNVGYGVWIEGTDTMFSWTETFTIDGDDLIVPGGEPMGGNMRIRPIIFPYNDYSFYQIVIVAGGPDNLPALPALQVEAAPEPATDPDPVDDPEPVADPDPIEDPLPYDPVPPTADDVVIVLTVGSDIALVNGVPVTLDAAPFTVGGRTMVPLRFISYYVPGAAVTWERPNAILTHPNIVGSVTFTQDVEHTPGYGATIITGGRTFLPFRLIGNLVGAEVEAGRDAQNRVVVTFRISS